MQRRTYCASISSLSPTSLQSYGRYPIVLRTLLHEIEGGTGKYTLVLGMLSIVPFTALTAAPAFPPCSTATIGLFAYFGAIVRRSDQERIWLQVSKTQELRADCKPHLSGQMRRSAKRLQNAARFDECGGYGGGERPRYRYRTQHKHSGLQPISGSLFNYLAYKAAFPATRSSSSDSE